MIFHLIKEKEDVYYLILTGSKSPVIPWHCAEVNPTKMEKK